jgi:hypothetical protein
MALLIRALILLLKNWRVIISIAVALLAGGFSTKIAVQEVGNSILKLWPILALACIAIILREFLKGYFDLKRKDLSLRQSEGKNNEGGN